MGAKEDGSSAGHIWTAEFYHVESNSLLAVVLKLTNRLFL
jgi:hypothetical protein